MIWVIFLAGFMAIFGVLGYLRGVRAATVTLIAGLLGLLIIGPLGATVIRYINAFGKGVRFLTSGGMGALAGTGSADAALEALRSSPPLIQPADNAVALGLLYVIIVLIGLLISTIPWFKGTRSVGGMILGLIAGYLVGGVVVRALWPQFISFLPLPILSEPASAFATPLGTPGTGFGSQLVAGLTALANSSFLPVVIAIVIVLFIIAATRSGSRNAKG